MLISGDYKRKRNASEWVLESASSGQLLIPRTCKIDSITSQSHVLKSFSIETWKNRLE